MTFTNSSMISDYDPADFAPASSITPAGAMVGYGGVSAPSGWLICDGSAVNRVTYSDLFAAISTNFGVGDGSTTFNLPDTRGRVMSGLGTGDAANPTAWALGDKKGDELNTLTEAQLPTVQIGSGITMSSSDGPRIAFYGTRAVAGAGNPDTNSGSGTLEALAEPFGNDEGHNIIQPTLGVNVIIKI